MGRKRHAHPRSAWFTCTGRNIGTYIGTLACLFRANGTWPSNIDPRRREGKQEWRVTYPVASFGVISGPSSSQWYKEGPLVGSLGWYHQSIQHIIGQPKVLDNLSIMVVTTSLGTDLRFFGNLRRVYGECRSCVFPAFPTKLHLGCGY